MNKIVKIYYKPNRTVRLLCNKHGIVSSNERINNKTCSYNAIYSKTVLNSTVKTTVPTLNQFDDVPQLVASSACYISLR